MNIFEKIWARIVELFAPDPKDERTVLAVDLPAELDRRAEEDGRGLRWRVSIVDFLTLLDIDSDAKNRELLGEELGIEGRSGEAQFNEDLRKAVYKKVSENGGRVPKELLD